MTQTRFVTIKSGGITAVNVTESQSLILALAVDIVRIDITAPIRIQRVSTLARILRKTIALVVIRPSVLITAI